MFLHFSYSASLGVKSPTMVLKVCFMWEHPIIACVGLIFLVWELFLIWMPASSFLSMCQPLSPWWVLCRCSGQCPPLWQARAPSTYAFSGTYTTLQPLQAVSMQLTPVLYLGLMSGAWALAPSRHMSQSGEHRVLAWTIHAGCRAVHSVNWLLCHPLRLPTSDEGETPTGLGIFLFSQFPPRGTGPILILSLFYFVLHIYIGEGNGTPLQYSCLENPWMEEPGRL